MIKFEELVLEQLLLLEFIPLGTAKPISTFIGDTSELTDLKTKLNTFGINLATSSLSPAWYRNLDERILLRFTISVAAGPEFLNLFPYVDFLALVKQSFPSTKFSTDSILKDDLEVTETSFINGITGDFLGFDSRIIGSGTHPFFNYTPCSNLLKSEYPRIKREVISSNIIGKMVVKNLETSTVKKAIYTIINSLQPTPKNSVPETNNSVDEVIANPNNYLPGQPNVKTLPSEVRNAGAKFFTLVNVLNELNRTIDPSSNVLNFIKTKTIANIKSETSDEAKEFIQLLEELANVIPKAPTKDFLKKATGALSGAAQLAKGLSLGVPTMGSR